MSNIPTAADSIPALTGSSDIAKKKRFDVGLVFWIFTLWIAITVLAAIFASLLGLQDPNQGNYDILNQGPTTAHWFGTDDLGRDIFSRVIYGARVSLTVGFGALTIGMIIGGTLGMIAAYRRGPVDIIVSSASYVMLAFPALVAVIAIVAFSLLVVCSSCCHGGGGGRGGGGGHHGC